MEYGSGNLRFWVDWFFLGWRWHGWFYTNKKEKRFFNSLYKTAKFGELKAQVAQRPFLSEFVTPQGLILGYIRNSHLAWLAFSKTLFNLGPSLLFITAQKSSFEVNTRNLLFSTVPLPKKTLLPSFTYSATTNPQLWNLYRQELWNQDCCKDMAHFLSLCPSFC